MYQFDRFNWQLPSKVFIFRHIRSPYTLPLKRILLISLLISLTGMLKAQQPVSGGEAIAVYESGDYKLATTLFKEIAVSLSNQPVLDSFYYYSYLTGKSQSMENDLDGSQTTLESLFGDIDLDDPPAIMGKAWLVHGTNRVYMEDYDGALESLSKATSYEQALPKPDKKTLARINQWQGYAYLFKGDFELAQQHVETSHQIRTEEFDSLDIELGISYSMLGNFFFDTYQWRKAYASQQSAIRIFKHHFDDSHINLAMMYNNQSNAITKLGDPELGKFFLDKAIESNEAGDRNFLLPMNYGNLADLYYSVNDYEQAEIYWRKAITVLIETDDRTGFTWANQHDGLGGIMMFSNQYATADSFFRIGLLTKENLLGKSHPEVSQSLFNIGLNAIDWGKPDMAKSFLQRSLEMREETLGKDHPKWAASNSELGQLAWNAGDHITAIEKWEASLQVYEAFHGLSNGNTIKTVNRLSKAYSETGQISKAEAMLKLGWTGACGMDQPLTDLAKLKNANIGFYNIAVLDMVEVHLQLLEVDQSQFSENKTTITNAVMRLGIELISVLGPLQSSAYQSTALANQVNRIVNQFSRLVHNTQRNGSLDMDMAERLLAGIDRSRAVTIQSAFRDRKAMEFGGIPDSLVNVGRKLGETLRYAKSRKTEDEDNVVNWDSLEFQALRQWNSYQEQLKKDYPNYYLARFSSPEISVSNVQKELTENDQTLLVYFDLDSVIIALVIDDNEIQSKALTPDTGWIDSLVVFRNLVESLGNKKAKYQLSHYLYQELWEPIASLVRENVVIIPDGNIHYLNFEILLASPFEEGQSDRELDWLIRSHAIHYTNHLPGLDFEDLSYSGQGILGVAPGFSEELKSSYLDALDKENNIDSTFINWVRTPWSQAFVETLGKKFKASILIGKDATEQGFKGSAPDAGILHFGTHAQLEDREPLLSFLALTPQSGQGDGYLYAYELYNQPLNAGLAVLAACKTGLGAYQKGEGVLSLAHAFRYAGCPSVVYSLWSIDDQQSNVLLEDFYANIDRSMPYAEALQKAKLDYLDNQPDGLLDPFYWGGMVLTGDNTVLPRRSNINRYIWWGGALLLAFVIGLLFFRKP
ncbi:MAG: CHAT domain-containing tetratricopeptide repeat protein [Bacteroidota bacterium]